jgi:photosystem II stability/assembly factor-like uncharacterized protein
LEKKQDIISGKSIKFFKEIGFIVGNNGNILKTIDNGNTWIKISSGSTSDFNSINILNEKEIIVSSSNAILKSLDGGLTWITQNIPNNTVNKTFFTSPLIGHAACKNGTMLKTIDGGTNWYITQSSTTFPSDLFTVYFINQNIGFYTKQHGEMYKTVDGGETWSKIATISDAIYTISFVNEDVGYVAGEHGVVFKTVNGGNTWQWASFQNGRIYDTSMFGIHFLDSNIGFATGARGRIIKTIDGGITWTQYSPTYNNINQIQFFTPYIGAIKVGSDYFKTINSGTNWTYVGTPKHFAYSSGMDFIDENIGYSIGGGSIGDVFKTEDGGTTWNKLGFYHLEALNTVCFIDKNIGFISGGYNYRKTLKTIDGGATWNEVSKENFGQIQFIGTQVGFASNIGYSNGKIYKSIDGGNTWLTSIEITKNITSFDFLDENNGYFVGSDRTLYKTKNGGQIWQKLNFNLPNQNGGFVKIKFYSKNIGYIFDDYGVLFKTTNGGLSWENIATINSYGSPSNSISIIEKNIYVGGSNGKILKSESTFNKVSLILNPISNPTLNTTILSGFAASNEGTIQNLRFEYFTNFDSSKYINATPSEVAFDTSTEISTTLPNLTPNTTYNCRLIATSNQKEYTSDFVSFTTPPAYVLNLNTIYNYSSNKAELTGNIQSNQNEISGIEFQYTKEQNFSNYSSFPINSIIQENTNQNIKGDLTNLDPSTAYFTRIKAIHQGKEIFSEIKSFTTKPKFEITLYNPSINGNQVKLSALISANSENITNITFEYGTQNYENSITTDINQIAVNSSNYVSALLENLDSSKTYYYRIKALQGSVLIYSFENVFNTSGSIILAPLSPRNENNEAKLIGLINSYGKVLTNIKFEYGTTDSYGSTIEGNPNFVSGYNTKTINATITNLLPNQTYFYRMSAMNNGTQIYSNKFQFTNGKLSIADFQLNENSITLFPNPTHGEVYITINENKNVANIKVIDLNGKVIDAQNNPTQNKIKIDLSNKTKGVYFVKLQFTDNTSVSKKLILK